MHTSRRMLLAMLPVLSIIAAAQAQPAPAPPADRPPLADGPPRVSGIYPHLAAFNGRGEAMRYGECGIGAVVPWAGKLWFITYPPHMTRGSDDKLYSVDERMRLTIHPESVGGTHASRMIHAESQQLIIGPYFIDAKGKVRAADVKGKLVGRMTAVMRHLTDPANKVYFFDMEGAIYEVDVHSLAVTKLFAKPVPGWHGKGGYTAQGRIVIANNGESGRPDVTPDLKVDPPPPSPEDAGALAEWDGKAWRVIERRQFTDVTGPGDIRGNPDDKAPLWTMGWDKRSVILKLLDGGTWRTFRLPKGSHAFDPRHGYYTEWPRIREVFPGRFLMVMHGQMFRFPKTFSAADTAGIRPVNTHLRYVPDFCGWGERLVMAGDDTSTMQNPLAGQSQSNLWFGRWEDLPTFGAAAGWGGVWVGDAVKAKVPSDPFLVAGYAGRVLHVSHRAERPVDFTIEADADGRGQWKAVHTMSLPPKSYGWHVLPADLKAEWVRLVPGADTEVSAYFHVSSARTPAADEGKTFAGFGARDGKHVPALVRPAAQTRNLQVVVPARDGKPERYYEVDERLAFTPGAPPAEAVAIRPKLEIKPDIAADAASLVLTDGAGKRWRLPRFDDAWDAAAQRGLREIQSERYAAHWGGIFYEVPRGGGGKTAIEYQKLRPVASSNFPITDYCTWRGLLVLSGVRADARPDGHVFRAADGGCALWFGAVDDLWKLGKPRGRGGPWLDTPVKAGRPSDPYLMTNFDRKRLALRHDAARPVTVHVEVDFANAGAWRPYASLDVPPGAAGLTHEFPPGYAAHWVRVTSDADVNATAQLVYE